MFRFGPEAVAGDKFRLGPLLGSTKLNTMTKLVVSRSLERVDRTSSSPGSTSVVRTLMQHDLVDEYRLLLFPMVIGKGTRLFEPGAAPIDLDLVSAETSGPAVLVTSGRTRP